MHFIRERVLQRWKHATPPAPESERANRGDQWLVDEACALTVPLISNEGLKTDGTVDPEKGIHKKARAARVTVMTPRAFFAGKLDEGAQAEAFHLRFVEQARLHVQGRTDKLEEVLRRMARYHDVILSVHAAGEGAPIVS